MHTAENIFSYSIHDQLIRFEGNIEGKLYKGFVEKERPFGFHIMGSLSIPQRFSVEQKISGLVSSLHHNAIKRR